MKNISLEKVSLWIGIISLWTFLFLLSNGALAQTNWTNIGNGLQTRVVAGFREYRFTAITGYQPFNVTDSLKKKITTPDPLIPSVVIGTTLSTNVIGMVGYSQTPMGDQLAMYNFGGQLSTADPVDPTDAVNKQTLDGLLGNYVDKTTTESVSGVKSFLSGASIGGVFNDRPNVGDPPHVFNVVNNAGSNSDYLMQLTTYANSTGQANWHVRKARGTYASPLPVLSGDLISSEGHRGFDGTNFAASSAAQLSIAEENFDATHNGTSILFQTTPLGNFGGNRVNALKLQASGDALFYKSVQSNNASLPNFILNSLGANYGLISNISEGQWSLGYGASATSLGTSVLIWGASGVKVNVISEYADNAAAVAAGLTAGAFYRTGDLLKIVH